MIFGILLAFELQFLYIFGVLNQGGNEPKVNPRQGLWSVDDRGDFFSHFTEGNCREKGDVEVMEKFHLFYIKL